MDDKVLTVLDDEDYVYKMNYYHESIIKDDLSYLEGAKRFELRNGPRLRESYRQIIYKRSTVDINYFTKYYKENNLLCPMNQDVIAYKKGILVNRDEFNKYHSLNFDPELREGYYVPPLVCDLIMHYRECIVKLKIPKSATKIQPLVEHLYYHFPSHKCRTNRAKVLAIETISGYNIDIDENTICVSPRAIFTTDYTIKYKEYKVGHWVYDHDLDEDIYTECSSGISFFTNRVEAVKY